MQLVPFLPLFMAAAYAIPYYQVERPSFQPGEAAVSKRQSEGVSWLCAENTCDLSSCPMSLEYGSGYPECIVYDTTESIYDNLLTPDENGQDSAFFSFPEPGEGCRFIVRSPASRDLSSCGTTVLSVTGAACQRVALQSTFMLQFCCGTGDCSEAAASKRSDIFSRSASSGALFLKNATSGEMVKPLDQGPARVDSTRHSKRDCGEFVVTKGPYSTIGQPQRVSEETGCGPVESCQAQLTKTATESRTLSASVSIGDPWGIISATVGVDFTESSSRSWSTTWTIPEGSTGYVVFTPYVTCYTGHFSGDCADDGNEIEACYPDTDDDGNLSGKLSVALVVS
ncbi:hypothetical protein KCU73_g6434, partial [Aureobasidium melanogenum]